MGNAFQAAFGAARLWVGETMGFVNLFSGCLVYVHGQPENVGAYFNWIARVFQAGFAIWGDLFLFTAVWAGVVGSLKSRAIWFSGCLF